MDTILEPVSFTSGGETLASRLGIPTLMVHSEQATDPVGAHRFFDHLAGPKTALWTDGIQFDFYDQEPQVTVVDAIVGHLGAAFVD